MVVKAKTAASGNGVDVLITFDTTGSMYPCLTQVRRRVVEMVRRLLQDIRRVRISIKAVGDYCDAGTTYVTKTLDFTDNLERICDFVRNVGPTDGGDRPECYELALNEARAQNWRAGAKKVMVLIGDDVPHEPSYPGNVKRIDWRNELRLLLEADVHVYGVHAMPGIRQHSKWFYEAVAKETGGYYLTLDQFAAIVDIIFAICYKQEGDEQLLNFQEEVGRGNRMSRNMASVFQTLTGKRIRVATRTGLVPVPAGRFQILAIDSDMAIRDFVEAEGLRFQKGRGFYQFTKSELVQENKEVVLRDKVTGDMYTGAEAREMIGLPFGIRGKIKPAKLAEYDVFVQSTSVNRTLKGGTLFLYEVQD
jgi:hypothetical protein